MRGNGLIFIFQSFGSKDLCDAEILWIFEIGTVAGAGYHGTVQIERRRAEFSSIKDVDVFFADPTALCTLPSNRVQRHQTDGEKAGA